MRPKKVYYCEVCGQRYEEAAQAFKCVTKYGFVKARFKNGMLVKFVDPDTKNVIEGEISNVAITKPDNCSRKPHTIIYLVEIAKINGQAVEKSCTTISEVELTAKSREKT